MLLFLFKRVVVTRGFCEELLIADHTLYCWPGSDILIFDLCVTSDELRPKPHCNTTSALGCAFFRAPVVK